MNLIGLWLAVIWIDLLASMLAPRNTGPPPFRLSTTLFLAAHASRCGVRREEEPTALSTHAHRMARFEESFRTPNMSRS